MQYLSLPAARWRAPHAASVALAASIFLPASGVAAAQGNDIELAPVAVTANPLGVGSDELVVPVAVLGGRELALKRESTLGETLNTIPGVSAGSFGPNASRPVIRGLDSERVRILQNGVGVLDASSLSFDHAVAIDPLIVEQIDVVRGPAALLYGGSAVGGVVNAIDHRIPREALDGVTGRGEIGLGGAADQKNAAVVIDAGNGLFALHADAYARDSDDLDIPGFAVSGIKHRADGTVRKDRGRLVNSDARNQGGALGAALNFAHGYAGVSFATFDNDYGTVADPDVRIEQRSDRWDFAGEVKELGGMLRGVKLRLAHTDYRHREIEDGEVGTIFTNIGNEGALEAAHASIGRMTGVLGVQFQNSRFTALGDEAFVPGTRTRTRALYVYEELPLDLVRDDDFKLTFGARAESAGVDSAGGERFGPAQDRSFRPNSFAAGALYQFDAHWSLAGNVSHNERAPSYFELYAYGPHLATGQFEIGDASLEKERANGVDAKLRWKSGRHSFSLGAYYTRFSNFISLASTGNTRGTDGELNPVDADADGVADGSGEDILEEARFLAVPAVFRGMEAEGSFRVYERLGTLDLKLRGDYVRATNRDSGEPLPRISPLRLGAGLDYRRDRLNARLDVLRAFRQDRTAEHELPTDGYTRLDALLSYRLPTRFGLEAYLKGSNLLDREIREHSAFLKDIAPLGGRALLFGLRGEF